MAVAPLGGGESPRGRGIGRCGIGDYGIEKSSSIGQNGDDGGFLLKKTHLIFCPESAISLKIFIFLKTHFKRPPRKRGLPARPRPCLCHECARGKNHVFPPLWKKTLAFGSHVYFKRYCLIFAHKFSAQKAPF